MSLHATSDGTGPRLVLVHGFAQTGRCWGREATDLTTDHEVVRVDAPGHGHSHLVRADFKESTELIVEVGGLGTYLGYSMGARLCLTAALAHPSAVRGLVLISGTAGIDDPSERAARRQADAQLAERIRVHGLDAFLDAWLDLPLFAGLPPAMAFREERLTNTTEGLAASLEEVGTGSQDPSWEVLGDLAMPVLVVAGAEDEKFSSLASRLANGIGDNATVAIIPGAGHSAHLEQPDALLAVLRPWLGAHHL